MVGRVCGINLGLKIEARSCGSKTNVGDIFLDPGLQAFYLLCGASGSYDHHSRRQRIKRPGMSHLELFQVQTAQQGTSHALHHIE